MFKRCSQFLGLFLFLFFLNETAESQARRICFSGVISRLDPDPVLYPDYETQPFIAGLSLGQPVKGYFSFPPENSLYYDDETHATYSKLYSGSQDPFFATFGDSAVIVDSTSGFGNNSSPQSNYWEAVTASNAPPGVTYPQEARSHIDAIWRGFLVNTGVYFSHRSASLLTGPKLPIATDVLSQFNQKLVILSQLLYICESTFGCHYQHFRIFGDITELHDCDPPIVDPIDSESSLLNDNGSITDDPETLLSGGRPVTGVAADGAAQVVIKVATGDPDESVQFSVVDEDGHLATDKEKYGALGYPGSDVIKNNNSTILTKSVPTSKGPRAFVVYRAPADYAADGKYAGTLSRELKIEVRTFLSDGSPIKSYLNLAVIRPPIVLIHGLHSYPKYWSAFTPIVSSPFYYTKRLDYSYIVKVTASEPAMPIFPQYPARAHSLSLDFNAPKRLAEVKEIIRRFKSGNEFNQLIRVAAVRADFIGHSYGGLISRRMTYEPDFWMDENYNQGVINRLITLGTPHQGSHIATRLFDGNNNCMAHNQHLNGSHIFRTVVVDSQSTTGAAFDLQGGENFITLPTDKRSPAIKDLSKSLPDDNPGIRTAMLSGTLGSENFAPLNLPTNLARDAAFFLCGTKSVDTSEGKSVFHYGLNQPGTVIRIGDPLADLYSSADWNKLFNNSPNDALVSNQSAFNGGPVKEENNFTAAHGPGSVGSISKLLDGGALGFGGHYLQEEPSGAPQRIKDLLDKSPTSDDYEWLP